MKKVGAINVAIVGLGLEAEFIPIYQKHPSPILISVLQHTASKWGN